MQFRQRLGQILRMHDRIRRVLVAHFPAHGRTRRRADEEQLVALRQRQVLVRRVHGRVDAKVHADAVPHDRFAVERLPDRDGVRVAEEGHDDPLERLERRPGVHLGVRVDGLPDFGQSGGLEDFGRKEVLEGLVGHRG
jgi:hypothetical protein